MEPRPQRPRAPAGQNPPSANAPDGRTQAYPPGEYPEGVDPTSFIAPPRTEYDYSPLDLAPPGQRRRRQLVAAAVGVFSLFLIGAIVVFSYLLLRDEEPRNPQDDVLAAQTEIALQQATISAQQTIVAQAAADQTAEVQEQNPDVTIAVTDETPPVSTEPDESATGGDDEADETVAAGDVQETQDPVEETPAPGGEETESSVAGQPNLTEDQLESLLPDSASVPSILTIVTDSSRTEEQVAVAIGGNREAETNLETWGWSANVERQFTPAEPANVDPAATAGITASIHGFGSAESCAAALTYFSDILVESGWDELEAPAIGDTARLLTTTVAEDGTTLVALYVQDGAVLYRFGGASLTGDPAQDVVAVAEATVGA